MSYKIPFLNYAKLYTEYKPEIQRAMQDALKSGHFILQHEVTDFEKEFAEFLEVKHCIGLASGTDALLLALVAAGVGPGDEVITVSHTFIATIQVIHHLGAKPILVDVGKDGLMDMNIVQEALSPRTKAIIPVHLSGDVCNVGADRVIDNRGYGGVVIEDAAQAIGASRNGLRAGTTGLAGCFSFYPAKVLGTFGDAGALVTNDDAVAERVRSLRNHGGVTKYQQSKYEFGWNSRLDNVWAAALSVKLKRLPQDLAKREEIAQIYRYELADTSLQLPVWRDGRIWQDYVVHTKIPTDKELLITKLAEAGIEVLYDTIPNHKHPGLGLEHYSLPVTEQLVATSIRLPCNHFMTIREAEYVVRAIHKSGV